VKATGNSNQLECDHDFLGWCAGSPPTSSPLSRIIGPGFREAGIGSSGAETPVSQCDGAPGAGTAE